MIESGLDLNVGRQTGGFCGFPPKTVMHQGKLVFAQLMLYLPLSTFRRCVAEHMVLGTATGVTIAKTLVAILAGAFDPPPESLIMPWLYLGITAATALACATLSILIMQNLTARRDIEVLRTH